MIRTTTLCLMLGHHLRLWININPALGHRQHDTLTQYWFNVGPLFATTCPTFGKHWVNVGLSCLRCGVDNGGLMYDNCLRRWPNTSSSIQLSATGRTWITRICAMCSEPPTSLLLPGQLTVDSGGPNNPT